MLARTGALGRKGFSTCVATSERVVLLVRSLEIGGAERQVVELAAGLHRQDVYVAVLSFYDRGDLVEDLKRAGVPYFSADKRGRWDVFGFGVRLGRLLRQLHPSVLYSFLSIVNLIAVLLKPLSPGVSLVWGLRASHMDLAHYDWLMRLTHWLEPKFARRAKVIVANSEAGRRHAVQRGFPVEKIVVVPNGIDTERFRPDAEAGRRIRNELGLREEEMVVGLVARLDPMKDHKNFLSAAAIVRRSLSNVRFLCVGDGPAGVRRSLEKFAHELRLDDVVIWTGNRSDMPAVLNALDVACSASLGEGFSNSIGEAMACGVPVVGTDVGDTAAVIGEAGTLVPPSNPEALAAGIVSFLHGSARERTAIRVRARNWIVEHFSVDALVKKSRESWASSGL